jgi:ABC-type dipeptide/oligopeptide/nickel transport system permease subunit
MAQAPTEQVTGPAPGEPGQISVEVSQQVIGRSPWELFWRRFRKDKFALGGLFIVFVMIVLAVLSPVIAGFTHGPNQVFLERLDSFGIPTGPQSGFPFGVDTAGRDLMVRVIYGAKTSLFIAFFATGIASTIGVTMGMLAGFYRGKIDTVISRTIDVVLSLPVLLLSLGLVSACGLSPNGCLGGIIKPGLLLVSYVIALFTWPYIARIVRGQVLSIREKEFIESARSLGSTNRRIMFREILPNVAAPIIVYTTLIIPNNILFEAALSFLGIGVPQETPSWGRELADAGSIFTVAWWMMLFPGLFLFLTTLAFNLVGDGLRDALDPRTGG